MLLERESVRNSKRDQWKFSIECEGILTFGPGIGHLNSSTSFM